MMLLISSAPRRPSRMCRRREVGYAILYVDTFETIDEVVLGQPGDMSLLGARTLEGFYD